MCDIFSIISMYQLHLVFLWMWRLFPPKISRAVCVCVQVEVDGKDMQSPPEEGLPIRAARLQAKHWWSFRLPIHSQNRNASVKIVIVANPTEFWGCEAPERWGERVIWWEKNMLQWQTLQTKFLVDETSLWEETPNPSKPGGIRLT